MRIGVGRNLGRIALAVAVVDGEIDHRIKVLDGRRAGVALDAAAVQARDGRAAGVVDLERHQVIAPHPRRPGVQERHA
jgi:hypothetical protein